MTEVPLRGRTALLSDSGLGYLSHVFASYLRLVGIRHIVAAPCHPQTSGARTEGRQRRKTWTPAGGSSAIFRARLGS